MDKDKRQLEIRILEESKNGARYDNKYPEEITALTLTVSGYLYKHPSLTPIYWLTPKGRTYLEQLRSPLKVWVKSHVLTIGIVAATTLTAVFAGVEVLSGK